GLMVSFVGPAPFSAQFMGGMFAFVPESFAVGILMVVNTYVSQNLGAGRLRQTGLYTWAGMAIAMAFACLIAPLALVASPLFGLFGHAPDVTALEAMYFRYMVLSVLVTLPTRVLEQFFFGIHRPRIVLVASVLANGFNVLANYVLIFGKCGFPAMGLEGAAIGSVVSWSLQFALLMAVFLARPLRSKYATALSRAVRLRHCLDLIRVGWPAGVQLCNDITSWTLFQAALIGPMGTEHMAASTAAMRYMGISFMPAVGIGVAATAIIGRWIGQGRPDLARRRAHAAVLAAMVYMGVCGVLFTVFRHDLVRFFVHVDPEQSSQAAAIMDIGTKILVCAAVFQLFDAVGIVYVGALRGAGDTRWPMAVTIVLSWGVVLGGGAAAVRLLPQLGSLGPWIAASLYVVVLGAVMAWRFEGGAWRKIDLLGRLGAPGAAPLPPAPIIPAQVPPPPPADVLRARKIGPDDPPPAV
ncbi:MAG: MATE family efflux transporter, partial [Phycisphaerae bacterium]|nr:MATE family efflux transporter [Phycisphaerae bacterium]